MLCIINFWQDRKIALSYIT